MLQRFGVGAGEVAPVLVQERVLEVGAGTPSGSAACWSAARWAVALPKSAAFMKGLARAVLRFTIEVSDLTPVTLGEVRTWAGAG